MKTARRILFIAFCLFCGLAAACFLYDIFRLGFTVERGASVLFNIALPLWIYVSHLTEREHQEARDEVVRLRMDLVDVATGPSEDMSARVALAVRCIRQSKERLGAADEGFDWSAEAARFRELHQ